MAYRFLLPIILASAIPCGLDKAGSPMHVGCATGNITPDEPVALSGQRNVRISRKPATPIFASALAVESREGDAGLDQAIIVSCDLVAIRQGILEQVREKLAPRIPDFAIENLVLSATHTHTAPGSLEERAFLDEAAEFAAIPEVTEFGIRRQTSPKLDRTFGISMRFGSHADYEAYSALPDHLSLLEKRWFTEVASFQKADFESL